MKCNLQGIQAACRRSYLNVYNLTLQERHPSHAVEEDANATTEAANTKRLCSPETSWGHFEFWPTIA